MSQIDDSPQGATVATASDVVGGGKTSLVVDAAPQSKRSYAAFLHDLPSLLPQHHGHWAAYVGGQLSDIGPSKRELLRKTIAAGHRAGDILIFGIEQPQQVVLDDLVDV
jgi:hypothetical protein